MPIREHSRIIDTKKAACCFFIYTNGGKGCNNMSDEKFKIPQSEIDSLARMLLPKIQEYFSTEKGWREYEQWKQQEMTIAETKD